MNPRIRRFNPQPDRDRPNGVTPRNVMTPPAQRSVYQGTSGFEATPFKPRDQAQTMPDIPLPQAPVQNQPPPIPTQPAPEIPGWQGYQKQKPQVIQPPAQQAPPLPSVMTPQEFSNAVQGQDPNAPGAIVPQYFYGPDGNWHLRSEVQPTSVDQYGRPTYDAQTMANLPYQYQGNTMTHIGANGQPVHATPNGNGYAYLPGEIQASQQGWGGEHAAPIYPNGQAPMPPAPLPPVQQPQPQQPQGPGPDASVYDPYPTGPGNQQPQQAMFKQTQTRPPDPNPSAPGQTQGRPPPQNPITGYGNPQAQGPAQPTGYGHGQPSVQPGNQPAPQAPTPYTAPPSGLPLSPQFEQGRRALEDALAAELAQAGADAAEVKAALELANRRLLTDHAEALRQNAEAMNARGVSNSGTARNVDILQRLGLDRSRQDLALGAAGQFRDISRRKSGAQSNYSKGLAELLGSLALSEAQNPDTTAASSKPDDSNGNKPRRRNRKRNKNRKAGSNASAN